MVSLIIYRRESDPSFAEKIPYLSRDFPKNPYAKSKISIMVHSQLGSNISPPPSHYTTYLYQSQCNQLKEDLLNEANHHSSFSAMVSSPISPFPLIPTHRYKATHTNGSQREFISARNPMVFSPNHNKLEDIHGHLNTSKGIWDLSTKNIFQYGETSQVSPSLSPSLAYDAHQFMSVNPELQGDLSCNDGIGNKSQENDQRFVLSDQKRRKRIQNNNEIQHKDPNQIKGQWTSNEDRYIKSFKILHCHCLLF